MRCGLRAANTTKTTAATATQTNTNHTHSKMRCGVCRKNKDKFTGRQIN